MKRKRNRTGRKEPPKQPKQCKGCIWGNWDGVKQFCSLQHCKKLERSEKKSEV